MTKAYKDRFVENITVALKPQDFADLELLSELAEVPTGHIVRKLILKHLDDSRAKIEKGWNTEPKQISNHK
jgi:hypothetical protein